MLRIEDTDRSRFVDDAEADILDSLRWAGLDFDESPQISGPFGPYRQSERTEHYREAAATLLDDGNAYLAFDTPEELDALRADSTGSSRPVAYGSATRMSMRNSLTMSEAETQRLLSEGRPHVVRLKVPSSGSVAFADVIRGNVSFNCDEIDDQILLKSDGLPTYHLANVVDDHLMSITHVIRGEEWLPSTPKHVLLYWFLGWDVPTLAHLPLILSPTGGKLSKRNAEAQGIPVLVRDYIAAGFEPEALVNYIAFLGWNPGTEEELFDLDGLVSTFSLERVGSSGVQFSIDKLRWYNEQHLRRLDPEELARRVRPFIEERGYEYDEEYLRRLLDLMRDRLTLASDLADAAYFFVDPDEYDENGVRKRWKNDSAELLDDYASRLEANEEFSAASCEAVLRTVAEQRDMGAGRIIHPTRLAISGVTFGPGLFELMETLGKETCTRRIRAALRVLPTGSA